MKPVDFQGVNLIARVPEDWPSSLGACDDLPIMDDGQCLTSMYDLTEEERLRISRGAFFQLSVLSRHVSPVSVAVTDIPQGPPFQELVGHTITEVRLCDLAQRIIFVRLDGIRLVYDLVADKWREMVWVGAVSGLDKLIGYPIQYISLAEWTRGGDKGAVWRDLEIETDAGFCTLVFRSSDARGGGIEFAGIEPPVRVETILTEDFQ